MEAEASLRRARGREAGTGCGGWIGREAAEAAGPRGAVGREASWFLFSVAESRGKGEPRSGTDPGILLKWVGGSDVSGARPLVTSIPRLKQRPLGTRITGSGPMKLLGPV